ncbi:ML domain-containing protein [Phthorimaea operculella]|nr:ML domain-containing protein [Phthorimaea operculella]
MWRLIAVSCFLAVVSSQQSTQVGQCTVNNGPLPINVYIEGCVTPPCVLPQLQDVVMHIAFRAPRTILRLRTLVRAYLLGNFGLPYPLGEEAETCNFLTNSYCPVLENEVVEYTLRMYIESFFAAGVAPTLEFFVEDPATSTTVFCIRVPIRIAEPVGSLSARNATVTDIHITADN